MQIYRKKKISMVDSTKSRFAPYLMLWLVSRLVTRGIRIGEQQVFSERTRSYPPYLEYIYIYIYILDTHSLVGSDRDFYKDLSTHSSYSKSKSRHGGLGKRTRIGVVVVLRDGDLSYRRIDPRTY